MPQLVSNCLVLQAHPATAQALSPTMAGSNDELQSAEVASLKAHYGKACRVIADVGDFTYIVAIQPPDLALLTVKFQLPGEFMLEQGLCHSILMSFCGHISDNCITSSSLV